MELPLSENRRMKVDEFDSGKMLAHAAKQAKQRKYDQFPIIDVDCYAGSRGEETPRRFRLGQREIEITDVVDCWLTPDHRYFRVQDAQGDRYVLRHDVGGDRWELTSVRHGPNDELGADVDAPQDLVVGAHRSARGTSADQRRPAKPPRAR